jgi:hypothetical protein
MISGYFRTLFCVMNFIFKRPGVGAYVLHSPAFLVCVYHHNSLFIVNNRIDENSLDGISKSQEKLN